MFSHSQRTTMSLMRNRRGTLFSLLPRDVMKYISRLTDAGYDESDIAKLLHVVAYGNPNAVIAMLIKNPRLLLEAGNVMDPAGNTILRVTPYECALGAGDGDLAAAIGKYFAKLEDGENERSRQYARYQHHIDNMLKQPAYDFSVLLEILKDSKAEDVTAALHLNFNADIPLHAALAAFRDHFAPRAIKGGMHFNYANLSEAFKVYANEFHELQATSAYNFSKRNLFWRLVIGFIQRGMPACDRQAFAQGMYNITEGEEKLRRTFGFRHDGGTFPEGGDHACTGLGFDWAVGGYPAQSRDAGCWRPACGGFWNTYVEQNKNFKLAKLIQPTQAPRASRGGI
jgi:hypothetical protein